MHSREEIPSCDVLLYDPPYSGKLPDATFLAMHANQSISAFPDVLSITTKDTFAKLVTQLQMLQTDKYDFFPKSWLLPRQEKEMLDHFHASTGGMHTEMLAEMPIIILKPGQGSKGKGIHLVRGARQAINLAASLQQPTNVLAQVYIADPMLLDGFKFDLRVYMLVTSVNPLRAYCCKVNEAMNVADRCCCNISMPTHGIARHLAL
jgi:tubulin polyglutamylase TTLL6/13